MRFSVFFFRHRSVRVVQRQLIALFLFYFSVRAGASVRRGDVNVQRMNERVFF